MVRTKGKGVDPNPPAKKQKRSVFLPEEQPDDFMGLRTLNETQKNKWRNLCKRGREIQVTKFLSIPTLEKLGVNELVIELLLNAGLGGFLGKSAATYKRYTLEFLSTMERFVDDEKEQCVSFNLNDVRRVIKYDVVRELFGVEMSPEDEPKKDKSVEFFYFELTGKFMQRPYVRAKEFYHPAWRFLYKALSMTFFGNGEPAQTNATSIAFMQCAVSVDKIPDWVDYFFRRCESYSGHASG